MTDVLDAQAFAEALAWAERYLVDVRALTLKQPWAYAITNCGKRTENRGWSAPEGVDRILIHAGKGRDRDAGEAFTRLGFMLPPLPVYGAVVAVADIAFVCDAAIDGPSLHGPVCRCDGWKADGQYHWGLTNVLVLPDPIPDVDGRLGLWRPPVDVVKAVAAQLAQTKIATKESTRV